MPTRRTPLLVWIGSALALGLVLGGCTAGGQFDPTEVLSSDVFSTKKKLAGEREPLFPNGVPGAETGVPPDLVKGYQPPPEQQQSADNAEVPPAPKPAAIPATSKPKTEAKTKTSGCSCAGVIAGSGPGFGCARSGLGSGSVVGAAGRSTGVAEPAAIDVGTNQLARAGATRAAGLACGASGPRPTDGAARATELAESFGTRHLFTLTLSG